MKIVVRIEQFFVDSDKLIFFFRNVYVKMNLTYHFARIHDYFDQSDIDAEFGHLVLEEVRSGGRVNWRRLSTTSFT